MVLHMELRFWCSYAAGLCTYDLYFPDPSPRFAQRIACQTLRSLALFNSACLLCLLCVWVGSRRTSAARKPRLFFFFFSFPKGRAFLWSNGVCREGRGFRIRWVSFLGTSGLWIDMIVISGMGSDRCTDGLGGKLSIRSCRWSRFMYVGRVSSIIY